LPSKNIYEMYNLKMPNTVPISHIITRTRIKAAYGVKLTQDQKDKLADAYEDGRNVILDLKSSQFTPDLRNSDFTKFSNVQNNRIRNVVDGTVHLKFTRAQLSTIDKAIRAWINNLLKWRLNAGSRINWDEQAKT